MDQAELERFLKTYPTVNPEEQVKCPQCDWQGQIRKMKTVVVWEPLGIVGLNCPNCETRMFHAATRPMRYLKKRTERLGPNEYWLPGP